MPGCDSPVVISPTGESEMKRYPECSSGELLTPKDKQVLFGGTELDLLEWAEGLRQEMADMRASLGKAKPVLDAWSKMNALVASKEWNFRLEHIVLEDVWYAHVSIAGVGYEDYGLLAVDAINTLAKRVEEDRSIQVVVRD
jgi:hypothetical protein